MAEVLYFPVGTMLPDLGNTALINVQSRAAQSFDTKKITTKNGQLVFNVTPEDTDGIIESLQKSPSLKLILVRGYGEFSERIKRYERIKHESAQILDMLKNRDADVS